MNIDWKKQPKAVAALVTTARNLHHPKIVLVREYFKYGCKLKGTDCDGDTFSASDDYWEIVMRPEDPWSGEGLPPVGMDVDIDHSHCGGSLTRVKIIAHIRARQLDCAVYQVGDEVSYASRGAFRPIRTPEQVAAEERVKACQQWLENIAQAYGADVADKCEDILMDAEKRKVPSA